MRLILLLLLVGCPREKPPPAAEKSCLDQQLEQRGLNEFGDPAGTMYPGGTPLFDEKTGQRKDREVYVFGKHADIASACGR